MRKWISFVTIKCGHIFVKDFAFLLFALLMDFIQKRKHENNISDFNSEIQSIYNHKKLTSIKARFCIYKYTYTFT